MSPGAHPHIKIDYRRGKAKRIAAKVESLEKKLRKKLKG